MGLCQCPQRVALANLNARGGGTGLGARRCYRCCRGNGDARKLKLGSGADFIGIADARVDGEEFAPAIAAAKILLRQLPERVARPDADRVLRGNRRRGSARRLYRLNHDGWRGRSHRLNENTWRREVRRNFRLRGRNHPSVRAKCWTNILTEIRTHICMNGWAESFANFAMNVAAHFRMNRWTNIFANARTNFRVANFWTNRNGGERIAAKNI